MKTQKKMNKKTSEPKINVSTKNDIKNIAVYANRLIRGIDNETASVRKVLESNNKRMDKVTESINNLSKVLAAVTNAAITNADTGRTEKATTKASTNTSTKSTAKPASKTSAKAAKVAPKTAAKVSKPTAKPNNAKAAKAAPQAGADNRPPLKKVIDSILSKHNGPVKASVIYAEATSGGTHWSRQSLYNALKDTARYTKIGDGNDMAYQVATKPSTVTEDEADKIINKIETAVANVL
jgi:hypothetical protein